VSISELAPEQVIELPGGGRVLFTTRAEGNLSTATGDDHDQGMQRREQLCARLGLPWVCSSRQVHGTAVHMLKQISGSGGEALALDADGHATTARELGVMVMAADCLPVALSCASAVAIVHVGWRGLSAGVLEQGLSALRTLAGDKPAITAVVGPGAGVCCYEVGPEVHHALGAAHARGRHIDLRAIARERLLAADVGAVRDVDACTICDPRFFSHRREGIRAGRQAGVAWLS
jgi:YfiH family protein